MAEGKMEELCDLFTKESSLPHHEISSARCDGPVDMTNSSMPKQFSVKNSNSSPEVIVPITQATEEKSMKDIKKEEMTPGKKKLYGCLNRQMKIEMTDGRVLAGLFLCTDRDANVILGSCTEYLNPEVCGFTDEPRILGLVMVPGRHIVSIHHTGFHPDPEFLHLPEKAG